MINLWKSFIKWWNSWEFAPAPAWHEGGQCFGPCKNHKRKKK